MAPAQKVQQGRVTKSKASKARQPTSPNAYSQSSQDPINAFGAGILSLSTALETREARGILIKQDYASKSRQINSSIRKYYNDTKKELVKQHMGRLQKLLELTEEYGRIETLIKGKIKIVENTLNAAADDIQAMLNGRSKDLSDAMA